MRRVPLPIRLTTAASFAALYVAERGPVLFFVFAPVARRLGLASAWMCQWRLEALLSKCRRVGVEGPELERRAEFVARRRRMLEAREYAALAAGDGDR